MKQLLLTDALQVFDTLFSSAQNNMFKLEVLQDYSLVDDSPSLRAWLNGDKRKAKELGATDENISLYRKKCLASPAAITRVHIMEEPYVPYLEWEIEVCYKDSLLAHNAESILLVEMHQLTGVNLPAGDFWIFDDKHVLQWEYEAGIGQLTGGCLWDIDEDDSIEYFQQLKTTLLHIAAPLQ